MAINAEVERTGAESSTSLIRRFTKKVQGAGVLIEVRARRYAKRSPSSNTRKKAALKLIGRRNRYEELLKLGKIEERAPRRRR